jgi:penicillin-binding protein 1B
VSVRVKIASKPASKSLWFRNPVLLGIAAAFLICCIAVFSVLTFYYVKYRRIVDQRISHPIFNDAAQIYAAPEPVRVGDTWSIAEIARDLRRAGYTKSGGKGDTETGTYAERASAIEIKPGPQSYHAPESATIHIAKGHVDSITGGKGESLSAYELEPQLITGLFDAKRRSKRRLLTYDEIPKVVVNAIVSIEDRRFFEHNGINYVRLVEGVLAPLMGHRRMQGGSTLTMQMARAFFLSNERSIRRKLAEMMIATDLEQRFTKQQILEIYVNQVDMGQRASFNIRGFGEAAQAYFGKDIGSVNLPEAALLAGLVNGPSYFSPYRHPDRAIARRNIVLQAMFENHAIGKEQLREAKAAPLKLASPGAEADEAPYYIDLVRDRLLSRYKESELDNSGMRVYTALDPQLQQAAAEAIDAGMKQVDAIVLRRRTRKIRTGKGRNAKVATEVRDGPMPQVALIALDPHTGAVLALSGGRNYGNSQLNHAIASRPTGSIFKPFVYATALNTALTGDPAKAYTEATVLDATEGTFDFNGKPYTPHNFDPKDNLPAVSARFALMHSINTATIRLAEMVGYDKVVDLAQAAGIKGVKATPAMAIGAYDATPLEMVGAYTIFANGGVRISPQFITSVRDSNGDVIEDFTPEKSSILDPRVAFLLTDMLQGVINNGTAAAVRAKFSAPAAGKTGSSHDAWFAGYTSNLLCIVWVGNDDYTDIKIEGSKAAAPIWADFMVRAQKLQRYKDMEPFTPPQGVVQAHLDKITNLVATPNCPDDYDAYFIDGTVPVGNCEHPNGDTRNIFEKLLGLPGNEKPPEQPAPAPPPPVVNQPVPGATPPPQVQPPKPEQKPKKKGFWRRLFGGGDKNEKKPDSDNQGKPQ